MAMTHDYLDYLNQRVDIAPANSQEELQAAETIAALMGQHDLEASIEEFDTPAVSGLGTAILSLVMFVGVLVTGFGVTALTIVGLVLAAVPAVLAVLRLFGVSPSLSLGPRARSQNVVAVHRATGPLVTKGSRPIVIVAHYDTPRENFLFTSPLAPFLPVIARAAGPCSYAVAVCALVQLMGFIPAPARVVLWIVGILAALPAAVLAVGSVYERASSCTLGANDNKAAVASMLGVMENVRPSGLVPTPREPELQAAAIEEVDDLDVVTEPAPAPQGAEVAAAETVPQVATAPEEAPEEAVAPAPEPAPAPVEVLGVRHGEEVLRALEILPETCEIVYDIPEPAPAPAPEPAPAPAPRPATMTLPIERVSAPAAEDAFPEPAADDAAAAYGEDGSPVSNALETARSLFGRISESVSSLVDTVRERVAASREAAAHDGADESQPENEEGQDEVAAPVAVEPTAAEEPAPSPAPEEESEPAAPAAEEAPAASATAPLDVTPGEPADAAGAEQEGTVPMTPVSDGAQGVTREDLLSTGRFSIVMNDGSRGVGAKDSSGLTTMDDASLDLDSTMPAARTAAPRPAAPEDPEWGKSSFRPSVSSVARRASLFDLPDPLENESDPLGDPGATRVATRREPAAAPAPRPSHVEAPQPIETLSGNGEEHKGGLSGLMGRLKGSAPKRKDHQAPAEGRGSGWLGSDDDDDRTWRGGAAARNGLRLVEDGQAPSEDELRDAALSLGDDALIAHDIWFVALGGSSLDHAGMRAFLGQHRRDIRGCFVFNLDCIGAGELTLLTREGLHPTRRADRRLGRIVSNVARDLHVELAQRDYEWNPTDAWVSMCSSVRSLTIMGLNESGLPALSRTPDDVPENVSGDQANLVTEIVTEAIRRS